MKKKYLLAAIGVLVIPSGLRAQTAGQDSTAVSSLRVGYSNAGANTLAGAVDKVTEERMNKGLKISSLDALSGQAAGVQVTSSGNQEAMVSAVRVRGTTSLTGGNDPLVIIDGVTSDLTTLSTIYPADIESFTILKGSISPTTAPSASRASIRDWGCSAAHSSVVQQVLSA